jgi:sugar phosphate isomerase/epimerase
LSNGIFSRRTLDENLAAVKDLGFDNIEFNMKSVKKENDTSIYTAKKLVDAYGLNCLTLHAATLHVRDEVEIHRAVYYGKISADFAHKLSAPIMVVHSNVSRKLPEEQRKKFLAKIFREIKPYAESLNLKLALENLSYASSGFAKNVPEIEETLEIVDGETVGLTLDFCHAKASGTTISLLEKYHDRLSNVHISDRSHRPLTKETPNLKAFITKLKEYSYKGPLTMELNQNCTTEDILKTKSVLERILS